MAIPEQLKAQWQTVCAGYKGQRIRLVGDHFWAGRTGTHTGNAKFTQDEMGQAIILDAVGDLAESSIVVWHSWHIEHLS
ncbi:MAG: hypothetical protein JNL05_10445 [Flavobacteriales bacterium]|nr:hypothetical protein [Flavobacteriales bacterium]